MKTENVKLREDNEVLTNYIGMRSSSNLKIRSSDGTANSKEEQRRNQVLFGYYLLSN